MTKDTHQDNNNVCSLSEKRQAVYDRDKSQIIAATQEHFEHIKKAAIDEIEEAPAIFLSQNKDHFMRFIALVKYHIDMFVRWADKKLKGARNA